MAQSLSRRRDVGTVASIAGFLLGLLVIFISDPVWLKISGLLVVLGSALYMLWPKISIRFRPYLIGAFSAVVIMAICGAVWFWQSHPSIQRKAPPPVSLVGLRYIIDNYGPRMVDLRTASTSGIPVIPGQALRLFDLLVMMPSDSPGDKVQAEIYNGQQLLGSTTSVPIQAGIIKLGEVTIVNFSDGRWPTAWRVQPDWKELMVFLVTYRNGAVIDRDLSRIRLSADGMAWLIDPPNLSFTSIVYTVNNGPELVLDLRDGGKKGFGASAGDELNVREIWYQSNADSDDAKVYAEAGLSGDQGEFDQSTYKATPQSVIRQGIHKLDYATMSWDITAERRNIFVGLIRDDKTVMSSLMLPLKSDVRGGLVSANPWLIDTTGVPIERLTSKSYVYQGLRNPKVGQGVADLIVTSEIVSNTQFSTKYWLSYDMPNEGDGYAGLSVEFVEPQDLTGYQYVNFTISFDDDQARCRFFITDVSGAKNSILLGDGTIVSAKPDQVVRIPLAGSQFSNVNRKFVRELDFDVDAGTSRGKHAFAVSGIRFEK